MDVNVTLKNSGSTTQTGTTCPNIEGETAMNTVVNRNREFIKQLAELKEPSCSIANTTDLCLKVSSIFYDLHFNIFQFSGRLWSKNIPGSQSRFWCLKWFWAFFL